MTMQNKHRAGVEYFDCVASTWDDNPTRSELAQAVAKAILDAIPLDGTEQAMELGCGTGLVTALLAPRLGHILAVDSSPVMLRVLGEKLREVGVQNVEAREADLAQELPNGPFNLIFSSMTLHHIDDVSALFRRVHQRLSVNGHVAFADLAPEDGTFHGEEVPDVRHHGFDVGELRHWLQDAGFVNVQGQIAHRISKTRGDGSVREYPVLLVTARRDS